MNEKLCLITGGGSGIGRATAIKFAQNKINTIIVGRRNDALEETVSLADENSDFLKPVKADLSTENGGLLVKFSDIIFALLEHSSIDKLLSLLMDIAP